MTHKERVRAADRGNTQIVRAMDALDRASEQAELAGDAYTQGWIDAARHMLNSADMVIVAEEIPNE